MIKKQLLIKVLSRATFATAMLLSSPALFAQVKIGTAPTTIDPSNNLEVQGSTAGRKLSVHKTTGKMTYADATQGVDKVLTSDANGVASWKTPESQNTEVWVYAKNTGTQAVPNGTTLIDFNTEIYDRGANFNPATNKITAPSAGIYQLSAGVKKTSDANGTGSFNLLLYVYVNNALHTVLYEDSWLTAGTWPRASGALTLQLAANSVVDVRVGSSFSTYSIGQCYLTFIKLSN